MISVVVMAHRKRERWVPELAAELGGAEVVWDRHNDRHETGLRAMLAFDPEASHHLIVQDDAILCRDLVAGCERIASTAGQHPVALYAGSTGPVNFALDQMMRTRKVGFVATEGPHWGVAIILPSAHIPALAEWYAGPEGAEVENYDKRISRWFRDQGISCWYTAPSLVDHRTEDNPSLAQGSRRASKRRAGWFIGADRSALDLDFDRLLRGATVARFRNVNTGQVVKLDAHDSRFNRINRMARDNYRWERLDKPEEADIEEIPIEPDPAHNSAPEVLTPEGTVSEVLSWVGTDEFAPERAAEALEAELDSEKPRKTLVEALGQIVADAEGD